MTLDRRAARAARSLRASVAGVAPVDVPAIVGRQRRSLMVSFAAAAAAVLFIVGIAAAMPHFTESEQVATNPTVPDGTPIVVEPDDKPNDGSELVELDHETTVLAVRQTRSVSDSPEPYTVFYGHGEPGSVVTVVSAYAETNGVVGEGGEFEIKVWFEPRPPAGVEFPIIVTVDGQSYEFTFTSLFDPDNVEATAHQTYGVSDDATAYEKFFGTAPPGTEVIATSPYGSADTVAGENGRWDLKLWFDGPLPLDDPFQITVMVGDEQFVFEFVSVYEPSSLPLSITQVNTVSDSPNPYVQFVGTAPAGTHLLAQSEYGGHDIVVGESGEFSLKLWFSPLPPAGVQFPVTFKVNHEYYATYSFTSLYEPSGDVEVDQYNTSSDSPEPWVKFHVYGPSGTQVQILSPYGSITQTIQNSGDYVRLYFSSLPPAGQQFQVTVKINGITHGTYPFTSWFDPENVEVSVNQYNTSSDSPEPSVKFYGTAPVGTQIQILSAYGSWSWTTEAIEWNSGHRFFTTLPPAGEEFQITVKVNGDVFGTYGFTSYWNPNQIIVAPVVTSSETAEPYAKIEYYGPAGTSFQLRSAYGNSDTIVLGANGSGHLKLWFSSLPPAGVEFEVDVYVNGSWHSSFGFTSWYEPPA